MAPTGEKIQLPLGDRKLEAEILFALGAVHARSMLSAYSTQSTRPSSTVNFHSSHSFSPPVSTLDPGHESQGFLLMRTDNQGNKAHRGDKKKHRSQPQRHPHVVSKKLEAVSEPEPAE